MRKRLFLFVLLAIAAIVIGCARKATNTTADHSGMDHSKMDHSNMKSSPNAATAPYDLQFLDTMSAHHQAAIQMAGPCESKAQHAEVNALCGNIISSQQKEIADMQSWRDKWFPSAAPAMNMEMAGMNDSMKRMDMKKLATLSGNEFDLEFIKQMMPHHQGAVVMANEALQKSTKPEIKALANAIIKAQEAEIGQMKQWQAEWSG